MKTAYICDAIRTPIGAFGGTLASVRTDDLGAIPLRALKERNQDIDWEAVDDVIFGCANQAGEDNRNVARMSSLLAGLGEAVPERPSIDYADREWMQLSWRPERSWRAIATSSLLAVLSP